MNWETAAALSQIVAALGVVVSLVYLAGQVQSENRHNAVAAKLASTRLLTDFVDSMIASPDFMDLWLRGRAGETLSDVERHRWSNMCFKAFWFFSAVHFQLRMKTLSDEDWIETYSVVRLWLHGPGVRVWWQKVGRTRFGGTFVTFIDAELDKLAAKQEATPVNPEI
jgi:hypothetical protein